MRNAWDREIKSPCRDEPAGNQEIPAQTPPLYVPSIDMWKYQRSSAVSSRPSENSWAALAILIGNQGSWDSYMIADISGQLIVQASV